jgi:hypothetical protein
LLDKVNKSIDYDELVKQEKESRLNKMMHPPALEMITSIRHDFGKSEFMEGESGVLNVVLFNSGASAAENVSLKIDVPAGLKVKLNNLPVYRKIESGQKVEASIPFTVGSGAKSAVHNLVAKAVEVDGFDAAERISLTTRAFVPPELMLDDVQLIEEGDRRFKLRFGIRNISSVDAANVVARIDKQGLDGLFLDRDIVNFDLIGANDSKTVEVQVFTTPKFLSANKQLNLKVRVEESTGKGSVVDTIAQNFAGASAGSLVAASSALAPAQALYPSLYADVPKGKFVGKDRDAAFAVLIGNQRYEKMPNVDFAENDVDVMKRYLVDVLGYKERNVEVITNADYKKFDDLFGTSRGGFKSGTLRKKLDSVKRYGAEPTVFIYYSGHGAPSLDGKSAFLVPTDISGDEIDTYGYKLTDLYASLNTMGADDLTLVMDTCFSGNASGNNQELLFKGISPGRLVQSSWKSASLDSGLVFTSTDTGEVSHWLPQAKHSMFTYFYLAGLAGKADDDNNGEITVAELRKYVGLNVASETNGKQSPNVTGDANKVVARLR